MNDDEDDEEPVCGAITGRCEGWRSQRESGICSCAHCGKELHYRDGRDGPGWYTHDATPPDERIQHERNA